MLEVLNCRMGVSGWLRRRVEVVGGGITDPLWMAE